MVALGHPLGAFLSRHVGSPSHRRRNHDLRQLRISLRAPALLIEEKKESRFPRDAVLPRPAEVLMTVVTLHPCLLKGAAQWERCPRRMRAGAWHAARVCLEGACRRWGRGPSPMQGMAQAHLDSLGAGVDVRRGSQSLCGSVGGDGYRRPLAHKASYAASYTRAARSLHSASGSSSNSASRVMRHRSSS